MVATRRSGRLAPAPTPASPSPPPPQAFGHGPSPSRMPIKSRRASENSDESDDTDDEGDGSNESNDNHVRCFLHTTVVLPIADPASSRLSTQAAAAPPSITTTTAGGRLRDLTAPSSKRPRLAYTPAPLPDVPASDDDDPDPLGTTLHTLSKTSWGRVQSWFDAIAVKYAHEFEDDAEIDFTERVVIDPHELWDTVDPGPLVFGNLSGLAPDEEDESSGDDEAGEGDASPDDAIPAAASTLNTAGSVMTTPAPICGTALYDADFIPIGDAVPRYRNVVTMRRTCAHRVLHRFRPAPIDPPVHSLLPLEHIRPSAPVADSPPPAPQYDEDMNPLPGVEPATPHLVVKLTPGRAYTPGRSSRSRRVTVELDGMGASDGVLTPVPHSRIHRTIGATTASVSPCPARDQVESVERRTLVPLPPSSPSLRRKRLRSKMELVK